MQSKIAFYLRLSLSDGDLGIENKDESNSIENQRELLKCYLSDHEDIIGEITEYIDDGYTGTNFNRPAFKQMISDAKESQISTILVKDLSRLGRDYIEVGDYLEQVFPVLGIRFIAVNNGFDTKKNGRAGLSMDVAISNIINSMYSRDIGRKRKSTDEIKWKQGYSTNGAACYGFLPDPSNKGKVIIDEETAPIVRRIFSLAADGLNCSSIALRLNEEHIEPPGVHFLKRRKAFESRYVVPESERLWDYASVYRIIKNYEYTGALVRGKLKRIVFGSSHIRSTKEEEQTITEGAHEAIVTKEEFELAQAVICSKRRKKYSVECVYPLKGKVRCGNCHRILEFDYGAYNNRIFCSASRNKGKKSKCCKDIYDENAINGRVYYAIFNMLQKVGYVNDLVKAKRVEGANAIEFTFANIAELKSKLEILEAESVRMYESYVDGHISREEYIHKKKSTSYEITKLREAIVQADNLIKKDRASETKLDEICSNGDELVNGSALTSEMVEAFVECVYVHDAEHIEIVFKGEDTVKEALERI